MADGAPAAVPEPEPAVVQPADPAPEQPLPHLRSRDGTAQETTTVELFFDLVYVLAVTQLSQLLLTNQSWTSVFHSALLLMAVWWAWIYTTWMVNWLDPASSPVRLLLVGVGLASLLMAAALPDAFSRYALLFACAYVGLQVGRNVGGLLLLRGRHRLADTFARLTVWSVAAGLLWLAGALIPGARVILWILALLVELAAPLVWYRLPGQGPLVETGHPVEGAHFAERCQAFIIIALGESIVFTGAGATQAGLGAAEVGALAVAFLEAAALWWLYFGEVAIHSRRQMQASEDTVRLARDGYTYLHLPIIAGVILSAVGTDYVVAAPGQTLTAAQAAITISGPILYLGGELLFRLRMIRMGSRKRVITLVALLACALVSTSIPAVALALIITAILTGLGLWEYEPFVLRRRSSPARQDA